MAFGQLIHVSPFKSKAAFDILCLFVLTKPGITNDALQ